MIEQQVVLHNVHRTGPIFWVLGHHLLDKGSNLQTERVWCFQHFAILDLSDERPQGATLEGSLQGHHLVNAASQAPDVCL